MPQHPRMIAFNKRWLNPLMLKFVGTVPGPFAVIRHQGRRSGKRYETPIIVLPAAGGFVIALTYGPEVDWYRNWRAEGRATLLRHGKRYTLAQPEPVTLASAMPAFPRPLRGILRRSRTQDFVRVRAQVA